MPGPEYPVGTVRTVFRGALRRGNSAAGNPGWTIVTDSGHWRTETDAAINGRIDNITGEGPESFAGLQVDLELRRGRVIGITIVTSGRRA